jgi:hypothetical protein
MPRRPSPFLVGAFVLALVAVVIPVQAGAQGTSIRIMPPERATFAVGQRFDIRVEATGADPAGAPPRALRVSLDGVEITGENILDPGVDGVAGAGGTGATSQSLLPRHRAYAAPAHTSNFLVRDRSFDAPGTHELRAWTDDGAEASVTLTVLAWSDPASGIAPVRNVILFLGDGMSAANRTAARVVSRGVTQGKADGLLAMDRMEVTGMTMTSSLNSVITDSAPGMAALSTGHKSNNNQLGVYPDNTVDDAFDNPRVEYVGALMRRVRGDGFNVGLVTTADVTDATPAGNAIHTADRNAYPPIAVQYFEERERNGVTVLMGGGVVTSSPGMRPPPMDGWMGAPSWRSSWGRGTRWYPTGRSYRRSWRGERRPPGSWGSSIRGTCPWPSTRWGRGGTAMSWGIPGTSGSGISPCWRT